MKVSSSWLLAICLGFLEVQAGGGAEPGKADEPWRTVFLGRVSAEDYQKRVAGYNQDLLDPDKIEADKIEADKMPDWGILLKSIDPGSQGEAAGLKPGWILISCDGKELWHKRQSLHPEKARDIEVVSPDGKKATFHFGPGPVGADLRTTHRLEHVMLKDMPRGAWDRDMLTAVQAMERGEQDVAETALNHAIAKGMPPNPYSDFYAALFALDRGDRTHARSLCDVVLVSVAHGTEIPRFFREGMRTLGLGLNDMALLKKSAAELDGLAMQLQPDEIRQWTEHGADGAKESLLDLALAHAGENVMDRVSVPKDGFEAWSGQADPRKLASGGLVPAAAGPRSFHISFAGPEPMRDLIWEIKGSYGPNSEPEYHSFGIGLYDIDQRSKGGSGREDAAPSRVAFISIASGWEPWRSVSLSSGLHGGLMETQRPFPQMDAEHEKSLGQAMAHGKQWDFPAENQMFDLKFIRIGNEAEIIVNGVTYQRLPLLGDVGALGCEVDVWGSESIFQEMTLRPVKL